MKSELRENPTATRSKTIYMRVYHIACSLSLLVLGFGSFARPTAGAAEKIHASYGATNGSMAATWIAKEAALFKQQELDVSLVYISGGPRSVMALLGGSVQFINHSAMPSLEAYVRGADTVLIATALNRVDHSLMVQPNITTPQELRGKILGVSTLGALTDVVLREGLRINGLSEKDVTILPVGDLGARLSSLQTGRVHGAMVAGVQYLAAAKMGFRQLLDFSKLPIEISTSSILSRRSYVVKNPHTTLKFLKAWTEATYLLKSNPKFSVEVIAKYVGIRDAEILEAIQAFYSATLSERPVPTVSLAKSMLSFLSRSNPEAKNANPEGFIEPRFIKELEASGFLAELSRKYPIKQKRGD